MLRNSIKMQKLGLFFFVISLFLTSCGGKQSFTPTNTPTLAFASATTSLPTPIFTNTPIIYTSTSALTFTPTLAPTSTITPTITIEIPGSVKNSEHWAIVEPDRAYFWFMLNPAITEWRWFMAPSGYVEYEWGVEFPSPYPLYPLYSAEVTIVGGQDQQKGSIDDLLKDCDIGLWVMERGGRRNTYLDNVVEAYHFNGGILIILKDSDYVSAIIQHHPKTILFKTYSHFNIFPNSNTDVIVIYR